MQYVACVTRFSGFLLPGLTNDDEPISWYFGGFLTDLKVGKPWGQPTKARYNPSRLRPKKTREVALEREREK